MCTPVPPVHTRPEADQLSPGRRSPGQPPSFVFLLRPPKASSGITGHSLSTWQPEGPSKPTNQAVTLLLNRPVTS